MIGKNVYIIGIGGVSMSALAYFLRENGCFVSGTDSARGEYFEKLLSDGFDVQNGSREDKVEECDIVIYSSAIKDNDADFVLAKKLGKKICSRAEILGEISRFYKTISIAGTHGKTTTTGLVSNIFLCAGKDPTIHIGGTMNNISSNFRLGKSNILVSEACEYKDSFLALTSEISCVLNIEEDHLDYFKNLDNIFLSFQKFIDKTCENGVIIYNFDDILAKKLEKKRKSYSFGLTKNADCHAEKIEENHGKYSFDVVFKGENLGRINLPLFGKHNIYNALCAIAAALVKGVNFEQIKKGIESFSGMKRRMEILRDEKSLFIHDYAHHPHEIRASLLACKEMKYDKIIAIFQPHTYSRTRDLFDDFSSAFSDADEVILLPIYPAREEEIKGVSSQNLAKSIKKHAKNAIFIENFDKCEKFLRKKTGNNLFIFLGAGNIAELAYRFKK